MQVIRSQITDIAERIGDIDRYVAVLFERRHQVLNGKFPPVNFAVLERRGGSGWVRNDHPFDAVRRKPLAAGKP